jgi:pyruvate dehydrogenase E1 component alpha subunit
VESWLARDPLTRLRRHLVDRALLDAAAIAALDAEAEIEAAALRQRMNMDTTQDPAELFRYVYAEQTPALRRQEQELLRELADSQDPR